MTNLLVILQILRFDKFTTTYIPYIYETYGNAQKNADIALSVILKTLSYLEKRQLRMCVPSFQK